MREGLADAVAGHQVDGGPGRRGVHHPVPAPQLGQGGAFVPVAGVEAEEALDPPVGGQRPPVAVDGRHVVDGGVVEWRDAVEQPPGAVRPAVVDPEVVRVVGSDDLLVGGDEVADLGVEHGGELGVGDLAGPVVGVGRAGDRPPGVRGAASRDLPHRPVADVAVDVGGHQVVDRVDPVPHRGVELVDGPGPQHGEQDRQAGARAGQGGGAQREAEPRRGVAEEDRAVAGRPALDRHRVVVADRDLLAAGLERPVERLDVEILVVAVGVRHAPRDALVVPEVRESRHPDERQPDRVELGPGEVALVVHVRDLDEPVRVAGDEGPARPGAGPGQRPRVRPARHLDQARPWPARTSSRESGSSGRGGSERTGWHDERHVGGVAAFEAGDRRPRRAAPRVGPATASSASRRRPRAARGTPRSSPTAATVRG